MWSILAIICLFTTGIAAQDECELPKYRVCPFDEPSSFPETVEELEQKCKNVKHFLECSVRVDEKCKSKSRSTETSEGLLDLAREMCDEDGRFHEVFANNLGCISEVWENIEDLKECTRPQNEETVSRHIETLLQHPGLTLFEDESYMTQCLPVLHELACSARKLGRSCGQQVEDSYIELASTTVLAAAFEVCDAESVRKFLPTVVQLQKLEDELEEELSKRKK